MSARSVKLQRGAAVATEAAEESTEALGRSRNSSSIRSSSSGTSRGTSSSRGSSITEKDKSFAAQTRGRYFLLEQSVGP